MNLIIHQLLLADDDSDDCLFFKEALEGLQLTNTLQTVGDGVELMSYLNDTINQLPQAIFLDLNMPRKDGVECLSEIKSNNRLQQIPVIIISTSLNPEVVDSLYLKGAHYYIRKPGEFSKLKSMVSQAVLHTSQNNSPQPTRADFVLDS